MDEFQALLDATYVWPAEYTFKFVVPVGNEAQVEALVPDAKISHRPSRTGRFVSVTLVARMSSSADVIEIYSKARSLDGVVVL